MNAKESSKEDLSEKEKKLREIFEEGHDNPEKGDRKFWKDFWKDVEQTREDLKNNGHKRK